MARVDCVVQKFFWYFVLPLILVVVIWTLFRAHIVAVYGKFLAWMMDIITKKTAHITRPRKLKLFCELHDVASANAIAGKPFKIVEIGSGTGVNFDFYPKGTNVICVDPNPDYGKYLQKNASRFPDIQLEAVQCGAQDMSLIHDNSVDAVVGTLVLCSIDDHDIPDVLDEIRRILKPGGKYFYLEHVAAQRGSFTKKFQKFMQNMQKKFVDNCDVCKETRSFIEEAGFSDLEHQQLWVPELPRYLFFFKTILIGKAQK